MAVAGLRGTGSADWATDERPKNFREMILWRNPNGQTPLTALLAKMKSESTSDPEYAWYEEELNALRLRVHFTTGYSTTDTSIVVTSNVTDAQDAVPGDLFLVEKAITTAYDHEIIMVSSVTNTTTIVFVRAQAGTSAAPLANNTYLTKIGSAFAEGTGAPTAASRNPTKMYNFCQIFKTTYDITNTAKGTRFRTGDPIKNDKKRKMFDHSVAMELGFLFGKRHETTGANGKPLRMTGGLLWALSQYASSMITVFTAVTESAFTDAVYKVFDYDSGAGDERIMFAGNGFLNTLNKLAAAQTRTRVNFDGLIDVYGMKLQRWVLPQGTLYVKTHPLFNTHGRFTYDAAIIDPSALKYRYMRDTTFKDNIQANDADETKGQWLTEAGLEAEHLKTMGWLSNFASL